MRLGILGSDGMEILNEDVDCGKVGASVRGEPGEVVQGGEGPPSPGLLFAFFAGAFLGFSNGGGGILLDEPVGASF